MGIRALGGWGAVEVARLRRLPTLVISFQVSKRWCISVRYSVAVSRWRRGRKCGEI